MKATRAEVYEAIDGERDYQMKRWNPDTTECGGQHETAAFLIYIREYLRRAEELTTVWPGGIATTGPYAGESDLDMVRKITALGVACMEQNGAPRRA